MSKQTETFDKLLSLKRTKAEQVLAAERLLLEQFDAKIAALQATLSGADRPPKDITGASLRTQASHTEHVLKRIAALEIERQEQAVKFEAALANFKGSVFSQSMAPSLLKP